MNRPRLAIFLILAFLSPSLHGAQLVGGASSSSPNPGATAAPNDDTSHVQLLVGRSVVVEVGGPIARVSVTRAEVADAMVTSAQQLLLHGKAPGTISLMVWQRDGAIRKYEVAVGRDLTRLNEQMHELFPGEPITATESGRDIVISGTVSTKFVMEKAGEVAAGYVEKKEDLVNLLRLQEAAASTQVLLRVRFAEVSRSALQELGGSIFTGPTGYKGYLGRTTTEQFAAPVYADLARTEQNGAVTEVSGKMVFSDFLNLFLFSNKYNVGAVVRALQSKGLFQSLAEPNLIADNGKEASFLAGGEYPYPAVQGNGATFAVTIVFKEYGIRLNFMPTIVGDAIHLKVRPEVSSLDFNNAVVLQGFRVPALITRRAETEVELADGQTFAIAGLMNNTLTSTLQKVPGIGDVPILGMLFKSKAAQKEQTELVVMITPQILKRGSNGAASELPGFAEPFLMPLPKPAPGNPPTVPKGGGT